MAKLLLPLATELSPLDRAALDEPQCEWRIALAWRRSGYLSNAARAWLAHAGEAASS